MRKEAEDVIPLSQASSPHQELNTLTTIIHNDLIFEVTWQGLQDTVLIESHEEYIATHASTASEHTARTHSLSYRPVS